MSEQANQFIQQATQALQDGNFAASIELVDQALALDPNNSDALVLKGIAHAQNSQPDAASQSFRAAISADSTNPKAYYNLATHLYQVNQKAEAMAMAQEALRLDPRHAAARELLTLMEQEQSGPAAPSGISPTTEGAAPQASPYVRPGYSEAAPGAIGFVEKMGKNWTAIGWTLSLLSLGLFIWSLTMIIPMYQEIFSDPSKAQSAVQAMQTKMGASYDILSIVGWVGRIATIGWAVLDMVNRRGNYLWLIAVLPCSCCGLEWFALPLYLLLGRK